VLPTLADVRTVGFLAHRVEVELAHQVLEAEVLRPARRANLQPARLTLRERLGAVAANDLVQWFGQKTRGLSDESGVGSQELGTGWAGII
jgi:hypothetical protein